MMQASLFTSNFRLYIRRSVAIVVLITVLFSICNGYMRCTRKGVKGPFPALYSYVKDNTIDVLCVGSSHVFCNINPLQMFEDYGIAAYDFAGSAQSMRISYYSILDILKKHNPKVIVLDTYAVVVEESCYTDAIIDSNLMTMPINRLKYMAYKDMEASNWMAGFFEFPITHTRYNELSGISFTEEHDDFLGYEYYTLINPQEEIFDPLLVQDASFPYPKAEEYLRKTIELCQKQGISIVLVNAPYPAASEEELRKYNYVAGIAEEYSIPFLNGCTAAEEIGIDYATDCMDSNHLNCYGAAKYTKWIEEYLVANYDLEDQRNSNDHEYWRENAERFAQMDLINQEREISDFQANLQFVLENDNFEAFVLYNGYGEEFSQQTKKFLQEHNIVLNEPGILVINNGQVEKHYRLSETYEDSVWADQHIISFKGQNGVQILKLGNEILFELSDKQEPRINIYLYNKMSGIGSWDKKEYEI